MKAETIARLTAESGAPSGVVVRIDSAEMKRLLEERRMLLLAAKDTVGVLGCDNGAQSESAAERSLWDMEEALCAAIDHAEAE